VHARETPGALPCSRGRRALRSRSLASPQGLAGSATAFGLENTGVARRSVRSRAGRGPVERAYTSSVKANPPRTLPPLAIPHFPWPIPSLPPESRRPRTPRAMTTLNLLASVLPLLACNSPSAQQVASGQTETAHERFVAILVYEGVELLDVSRPGEVFSSAHGPSGRAFRVGTVAKTKAPVKSQGFVTITPQYSIEDCPEPDIVVVPGGGIPDGDRDLQQWVRACAESSELVMSVCNGAFLLAQAGLLDGLEVTTHHGSLVGLAGGFPNVKVLTNRRFVDSGRVMTCAGVSAGIDGALHVVERMLGQEA